MPGFSAKIYTKVFWICSAVLVPAVAAIVLSAWLTINPGVKVALAATAFMSLCLCCGCFRQMVSSIRKLSEDLAGSDSADIDPVRYGAMKAFAQVISDYTKNTKNELDRLDKCNRDLTLQIQLLQRQKQNTEAIIYSIRDAVIVTDASDRILIANQAAGELFGFTLDKEHLQTIGELIEETEFSKIITHCRKAQVRHVKHEITFELKDEAHTFDCILSCVGEGPACGIVAVLHDVTREKEISRMKTDFVSHVSHELKTPLASINAYAEMLVDGEARDTDSINQFCSIIQTQAQRLNRLIEDILNISRIESGLVKITKEPLSVAVLIAESVKMINSYAQEKNIVVNSQAPIIFDQVYADKDMVTQVIVNLLSNAVKYTPSNGSISITSEVNEADRMVTVKVTDTGIGIPPEDIGRVFDKFYRVEANKKFAKGTGLGLNLVKQIVEKVHGGRVFAASKVNQGSTFGFEMPLMADKVFQNS